MVKKLDKPWQLKPGERGIPFSVSEARSAANSYKMDQYHQYIIFWLCDRVEELEEQIRKNIHK
jgi:hypothetical protein